MRKSLILILLFLIGGVVAGCDDSQIDINSASEADLENIVWIGPSTAQKIIDARPFDSIDDLNKVKGIGDVKLGDIKEEGLACVSGLGEEKTVFEGENTFGEEDEAEIKTSSLDRKANEPILLNSAGEEKELIYGSKNAKILRYFPYIFSLFLIFIIAILLMDK